MKQRVVLGAKAPILVASRISKTLRPGVLAVQEASITLHCGELTSIVGESGCGKSTLVRILALQDHPDPGHGCLRIFGHDVAYLNQPQRDWLRAEALHYVPQELFGLLNRSPVENVAYWLVRLDGVDRSLAEALARQALDAVELPRQSFDQGISTLSGGQKARVAIAGALARQRPIFLADEVLPSLDAHSARHVLKLFRDLAAQGMAVGVVIHHQDDLSRYFDREVRIGAIRHVPHQSLWVVA